jgi:TfoX/Sxy family transcriptional regulator of competence genes
MATRQSTVDFILEQIDADGNLLAKKMFGEYGIFYDDKMIALVCDGQLFVKPTAAGREFIGSVVEGSPFPGAKPYLLVSGDRWDNREWLTSLMRITAAELPLPKTKARPLKKKN